MRASFSSDFWSEKQRKKRRLLHKRHLTQLNRSGISKATRGKCEALVRRAPGLFLNTSTFFLLTLYRRRKQNVHTGKKQPPSRNKPTRCHQKKKKNNFKGKTFLLFMPEKKKSLQESKYIKIKKYWAVAVSPKIEQHGAFVLWRCAFGIATCRTFFFAV